MRQIDIDKLKKHPIVFASVIAVSSVSLSSAFWYKLIVEDLRDKRTETSLELQVAKQRISSLESTLATYDGQCVTKIQAHSKEQQSVISAQAYALSESSKTLVNSQARFSTEIDIRDKTISQATARLNAREITSDRIKQLEIQKVQIEEALTERQADHRYLSGIYGINKGECERKSFFSDGGCELATENKAVLDSIEKQITSQELRLAQINQMIIQLQSQIK